MIDVIKPLEHMDTNEWVHGGMAFLFPFAGRVYRDNRIHSYKWGDNIYRMPIHGLAPYTVWQVNKVEDSFFEMVLKSNPETKISYPWDFEIVASFELSEESLICRYLVKNCSDEGMPLALGLHPYFTVARDSPALKIKAKNIITVDELGLAGNIEALRSDGLDLINPLNRSVILGNLECRQAYIDLHQEIELGVSWGSKVNYVVLWSSSPREFFCIEPWMDLPNSVSGSPQVLSAKQSVAFDFEISWKVV
jgi:galactose mutarotase-like enzyme